MMKNKPVTFDALRYANHERQKEWDPDGNIGASFRGLEFSGEIGEVIETALALMVDLSIAAGHVNNLVKKLERERMGLPGSRVRLMDLANELADAQITLDLLAMHFCLDLGESTRLKFNSKSEEMGFKTRL